MHRRHVASIAALALLALTAGCVGALGQEVSAAIDGNQTVSVSASGEVTAEPDQAIVHVSVIATGDTADVARQRLAANVSDLRAGLADANVSDDGITTSGYDIYQERPEPKPEMTGEATQQYVARQSFRITLSDTDRAGEIIDVAVASGATQVEGVQFTLSEDAQAQIKQEALRAAMDAARRNAETLAAAENLTVVEALHIRNTDVRPMPYQADVALAAESGGGTTIDGGPVTVTATVEVVYAAN